MEVAKFKLSEIVKKHCPEKLDGRLVSLMIARSAADMQRHMTMTAEERERELYETLKKKYEET